jgi:hypothetical protein
MMITARRGPPGSWWNRYVGEALTVIDVINGVYTVMTRDGEQGAIPAAYIDPA